MEAARFGAPCGMDILRVERYLETRGGLRAWGFSSGNCPADVSRRKSGHLSEGWAPAVAGAESDRAESH